MDYWFRITKEYREARVDGLDSNSKRRSKETKKWVFVLFLTRKFTMKMSLNESNRIFVCISYFLSSSKDRDENVINRLSSTSLDLSSLSLPLFYVELLFSSCSDEIVNDDTLFDCVNLQSMKKNRCIALCFDGNLFLDDQSMSRFYFHTISIWWDVKLFWYIFLPQMNMIIDKVRQWLITFSML